MCDRDVGVHQLPHPCGLNDQQTQNPDDVPGFVRCVEVADERQA